MGADLHFAGPANQRRSRADSISKVLFQFAARTQPITLERLQAAAAASCEAAAARGSGGGSGAADMLGSGDFAGTLMSASVASEHGGSMALDGVAETEGVEMDS